MGSGVGGLGVWGAGARSLALHPMSKIHSPEALIPKPCPRPCLRGWWLLTKGGGWWLSAAKNGVDGGGLNPSSVPAETDGLSE